MDAIHLLNKLKVGQSLRQQQRSLPTVYFSQSTPEWETCLSDLCQMAERTHERRYSPVYPSVSLLCFPMSQSIFILSLCSPDDLQRRSLLIPSAPSLWSHYKPHIYLIEPAACLLAWTAAGRSVCVCVSVCDECPSMHPVWVRPHPCVYCTDTPAYVSARAQCIIWRGAVKWVSVKCHQWRIQCPGRWGGVQGGHSLCFPSL